MVAAEIRTCHKNSFSLSPMGIGLLYNPALPEFLRSYPEEVDYIEIIPDMFWTDKGRCSAPRYQETGSWVELLDEVASQFPLVSHSIGFSIGSAEIFDCQDLAQIEAWQRRYRFPWHSDHLAFNQVVDVSGTVHNASLGLPVAYDHEVLEMIADRVRWIQQTVPVPFLIENNVHFVEMRDEDMRQAEFLNRLAETACCGLLLDLHNVYTDERNNRCDPGKFLEELALTSVIEIHIAGGNEVAGMYTDSHCGACPQPVWDLLNYVVPRAPNLCGITFEFHESYYPLLKEEGLLGQISAARKAWALRPSHIQCPSQRS